MTDDELELQLLEDQVEQCQLNAQALLIGTAQVFAADRSTLESWERAIAAIFLRGWDVDREWTAGDVLDAVLQNFAAFGALIDDIDPGAEIPQATISDVPRPDLGELLDFPAGSGDVLFRVGARVAARLGMTLVWARDDGSYGIRVEPARS